MTFEHPLVLAVAPLALGWLLFAFRPRRGQRAPGARIERRYAGARRLSAHAPRRARLRGALAALGALLALAALAGPQWGTVTETSVEQSREVLIALDLSRSMLADDVAPSRLERSKLLVSSLLDELRGEQVGLVVFAGTAFLQSPLSSDHEILRELLDGLGPRSLPQGGTDYTAMLRAALGSFGKGGEGDRYLVVLSDGEAHDEGWRELVPSLERAGIRVVALGVGTPAGAVLHDPRGGLVKDERGAAVLSRLEPGTLEELARQTGGIYRDAASWVDVAALIDATVAQGATGVHVEERAVRAEQRFQWLLAPAFACWLLAFWRELPVRVVRRRLAAPASALAAALWLAAAPQAGRAAVPASPAPAASAPAEPPATGALEATVAELAAKAALAAPDYARLAEATLAWGEASPGGVSGELAGVVDDALLGVDRGERESPQATDWADLRRRLAALKRREDPQPQKQPQDRQQQTSQPAEQQGAGSRSPGAGSDQGDPAQGARDEAEPSGAPAKDPSSGSAGGEAADAARSGEREAKPSGVGNDEADPGAKAEASEGSGAGEGSQPKPPGTADERGQGARSLAGAELPEHARDPGRDGAGAEPRTSGEEPKPIAEPEAGFGELGEPASKEASPRGEADAEPAATPPTRRVGGGGGIAAAEPGSPDLVEALSRQAGVRDADAPGVLFRRMQRSEEGRERPESKGKDW